MKLPIVMAAVMAAAAAGLTGCSSPPPAPPGCAALTAWWKSTGSPALGQLTDDVKQLVPLDAASWNQLQADATATPGYPDGIREPKGTAVNSFSGNWAAFVQDYTVGAQLRDTGVLRDGVTALKKADVNLKACGVPGS